MIKFWNKWGQDLGTYYIGKYEKVIVIDSSGEEVEQSRKRKRKSTTNMDEINKIQKKQIKAKRVIYLTGTLLALKKIKVEPKQKKKTKTKVKIEGDVASIVHERKKWKRKKKINDNEIIFVKPTKKRKKKSSLTAEQKLKNKRKKEEKGRKKKIEKTREKAISLIDFNKFIRDNVVEPGQRRSFDFKACNVKKEIIGNYQKWRRRNKARNLFEAFANDSKSVFYATNKKTKTLVKKARNTLYKRHCFCKYF